MNKSILRRFESILIRIGKETHEHGFDSNEYLSEIVKTIFSSVSDQNEANSTDVDIFT